MLVCLNTLYLSTKMLNILVIKIVNVSLSYFLFIILSCFLAMGEAEDASKYSKRCLQSGTDFCVDKKIVVEASDLLQKTQV